MFNRSNYAITFRIAFFSFSATCLTAGSVVYAQIASGKSSSLESALSAIADKNNLTFIIQGSPCQISIKLPDSIGEFTADGHVAKIASAYGYDSERRGNVFLLRKKYTSSGETFDISTQQCARAIHDIDKIISTYIPKATDVESITDYGVADALSDGDLATMASGFLPLKALSLPTQQRFKKFLVYDYFSKSPVDFVQESPWLDIPKDQITFRWRDDSHLEKRLKNNKRYTAITNIDALIRQFGVEIPEADSKSLYFRPLNGVYAISGDGSYSISSSRPLPPDPTIPTDKDVEPVQTQKTIENVVNYLRSRPMKATILSVDDAVKDLPIVVVNPERSTVSDVLSGVADVYGLALSSTDSQGTKSLRLTVPRTKAIKSIADVNPAIRSSVPAVLLHAMRLDQEAPMTAQEYEASRSSLKDVALTLRFSATRALRALAEPRIKQASDGKATLRDLGSAGENAFAKLILSDYVVQVTALLDEAVPDYLRHLDQLAMKGKVRTSASGQKFVSLDFYMLGADGKYDELGPSFHNIPTDEVKYLQQK